MEELKREHILTPKVPHLSIIPAYCSRVDRCVAKVLVTHLLGSCLGGNKVRVGVKSSVTPGQDMQALGRVHFQGQP